LYRFKIPTILTALFAGLLIGAAAPAQTVSIVSGNGQFLCPIGACRAFTLNASQPLTVRVTDANGNPLPNTTVNWATNAFSTQAILLASSTVTGPDGTTSNTLSIPFSAGIVSSQSYLQFTITATAGSSTAAFILTEGFDFQLGSGNVLPAINVSFLSLPTPNSSGAAGSTASSPAQVLVTGNVGQPIPNVAVFLANLQSPGGPTMLCKSSPGAGAGTVLTDATGMATCQPVFGPVPGSGQFQVDVGGAPQADPTQPPTAVVRSNPISFTTTAGAPGSVVITQGNGQTVNPGQSLPTVLGVQVNDASGNPLAGQGIQWAVSPAGAATLSNTVTTTDQNGRATNGVAVSGNAAAGVITVTATSTADSTKSASFTINVVQPITITGFTIVSGNNQSAPVNTAFGSPLVVQVTTSAGTGAANVPVQFHVASGSVSLNATNVQTDSTGKAQVTATAGSVSGAATVTATVAATGGIGTQTFSLTVLPPAPAISASNFVNGADPSLPTLSPCSIGALVGSQAALGVSGMVSTFPGVPVNTNIRITLNNISAPILSVGTVASGQQQILFQVPCEVTPGSVPVTVNLGGGTTNLTLNIMAASPGVYLTPMSDGVLRAVLVRPDGSFVSLTNPARRGETEVAYVTGLGPTSPMVGTSSVPPPNSSANVQGTVIAGMSGEGVPVVYARLSEDLPGVYVVAFEIPADITPGNDVTFSVGVVPTGGSAAINSNAVKVPVQ
jgi:uncharacterized protein (TIGR03437 family)